MLPLLIRKIVGAFEQGWVTWPSLLAYVAIILGASMAAGTARYFERTRLIGASRICEFDLRNDYFKRLQILSQRFFHRTQTGDLMARATNDLNYVRDFIGPGVMGTVDMIRLPFTLAMMIWLSASLTLYALIPLPIVSILVYLFVRYMNRQSKIVQEMFSKVTAMVQDNLAGARVVKAFGIADREQEAFRKASVTYMHENVRLVAVMSFAWPLIGMLVGVTVLTVIWQGGKLVITNHLTLADFTAFMVCMVMLAFPLAQFGWVLTLYQRGAVGMNRLAEILSEAPDIQDNDQTDPEAGVSQGHIRFDHVSFAYADTPVLHDIDVDIPAGTTLAITGPTGSGKTTLVALLTREYDPDTGRILIDGHDLRHIPLRSLRGAIGYVPQDLFIFSDTIRTNLTLGRPDASDVDIQAACEVAHFSEALEDMPSGFDTLLGERGVNLSGGQKQRLTLARALLCDPEILILDDALSSVDTHTEEGILHGLAEFMVDRTSVIISHRISTIRHADLILVVEDGRITEQGNHDSLIAANGLYARMHRRQLLESALEEDA
jgi:ATP-binding cassette subfamily B protein